MSTSEHTGPALSAPAEGRWAGALEHTPLRQQKQPCAPAPAQQGARPPPAAAPPAAPAAPCTPQASPPGTSQSSALPTGGAAAAGPLACTGPAGRWADGAHVCWRTDHLLHRRHATGSVRRDGQCCLRLPAPCIAQALLPSAAASACWYTNGRTVLHRTLSEKSRTPAACMRRVRCRMNASAGMDSSCSSGNSRASIAMNTGCCSSSLQKAKNEQPWVGRQ